MKKEKPKYRRRNYLINKSLQLRYMAMVAILMMIVSIATGWSIYSTTWSMLLDKLGNKVTNLDTIILDLNKIILVKTTFLILANILLAVIITMFISHRIAGPVFRVTKIMSHLSEGILPRFVKFRAGDELQYLATSIDSAMLKIGELSQKNRKTVEEASACISRLNDSLHAVHPDIKKAKEEIELLKKHLGELEILRQEGNEQK